MGEGGSGTQKFVYQKSHDKTFPIANCVFPFGLGGGGRHKALVVGSVSLWRGVLGGGGSVQRGGGPPPCGKKIKHRPAPCLPAWSTLVFAAACTAIPPCFSLYLRPCLLRHQHLTRPIRASRRTDAIYLLTQPQNWHLFLIILHGIRPE